jgi:molybdopterin molybdotransferase
VATYSYRDARALVIEKAAASRALTTETVPLVEAAGRVLGEVATADRDYPAAARSIRDGFAVRAADLPGTLQIIGEIRAGGVFDRAIGSGQCVEIMTGAPVPPGADAVVMVEHVIREGDRISTSRTQSPGDFINPRGAEAHAGEALLPCGTPLGFAQIALLAQTGRTTVAVYRRPRVAILSTGDEVISIDQTPAVNQVRNSNAWSLAVQVERAGGIPDILPVARDTPDDTRRSIERGLASDLLLLSGGVSAGKYDYVEPVLAECGAEFFFDRVLIQPGQPLVFGRARGVFFFGLPGNPASTMVTFEVFARAAVELLGGRQHSELRIPRLRLTTDFQHKAGLTRFLPARTSGDATQVTPIRWQGSSDVPALARSDAFLVAEADRESWKAGEEIGVLFP